MVRAFQAHKFIAPMKTLVATHRNFFGPYRSH